MRRARRASFSFNSNSHTAVMHHVMMMSSLSSLSRRFHVASSTRGPPPMSVHEMIFDRYETSSMVSPFGQQAADSSVLCMPQRLLGDDDDSDYCLTAAMMMMNSSNNRPSSNNKNRSNGDRDTNGKEESQPPERALRVAEAAYGSQAAYAYAVFGFADIAYALYRQDLLEFPYSTHLARWFGNPLTPIFFGPSAFAHAFGEERGKRVQVILQNMMFEYEQQNLNNDGSSSTFVTTTTTTTTRTPPLSFDDDHHHRNVASAASVSCSSSSCSPLINAIVECGLPLDPWRDILRGIAVAIERPDTTIDVPSLTCAIIASSSDLPGEVCESMPGDLQDRAVTMVRLLLGVAAEFGSYPCCLHAAELMRAHNIQTSNRTQHLLNMGFAAHMRRVQDWKFRVSGAIRTCAHKMVTNYFARVDADRATAAAAASSSSIRHHASSDAVVVPAAAVTEEGREQQAQISYLDDDDDDDEDGDHLDSVVNIEEETDVRSLG